MDGLLAQLGVSGIIALCGVIGTFYVMRSRVDDLLKKNAAVSKEMAAMWNKIEGVSEDVSLLKQKMGVIGGMMAPEAVEKHHKWTASVDKDLEYMKWDLGRLEQKTKCEKCNA